MRGGYRPFSSLFSSSIPWLVRSSLFTGSKDRACDRESREDRGKRKGRNHSGSRRDEQRGQGRYDGYSEEIPGSTQEDETSENWPDHSVRHSTRDR